MSIPCQITVLVEDGDVPAAWELLTTAGLKVIDFTVGSKANDIETLPLQTSLLEQQTSNDPPAPAVTLETAQCGDQSLVAPAGTLGTTAPPTTLTSYKFDVPDPFHGRHGGNSRSTRRPYTRWTEHRQVCLDRPHRVAPANADRVIKMITALGVGWRGTYGELLDELEKHMPDISRAMCRQIRASMKSTLSPIEIA